MLVNIDMELDFLDLLRNIVLFLSFQIFLLLKNKLTEVHDTAYRRTGFVRHQHQVELGVVCALSGVGITYDSDLLSSGIDQANLAMREGLSWLNQLSDIITLQ